MSLRRLQRRPIRPFAGDFESEEEPGGFLPTQLPTLRLWIRSDLQVTSVAGAVAAWADQSGAGDVNRNFVQANAVHQPTYSASDPSFNNHPSVTFALTPNTLFMDMVGNWSGGNLPQPFTMIVVGSDAGSGSEVFFGQTGANNWNVCATAGFYGASVGTNLLGTTADSVTPKIIMIEASDPANSTVRVNRLTAEVMGNGIFGTLPQMELGGAQGGHCLVGKIVEVIVYGRLLSTNEKATLMSYLGSRYKITIGP